MKDKIKKRIEVIKENLRIGFEEVGKKLGRRPVLLSYLVGYDPSSDVYRKSIKRKGENLGVEVMLREGNPEGIIQANNDPSVDGIIVHCPREDIFYLSSLISPGKDVEGITPENLGRLIRGEEAPVPPTAHSVMEIISLLDFELCGRKSVIVGRSLIVGKPLFFLLLEKNATVTIAHSKTKPLQNITQQGDVLVVAVGKPHFIGPKMVKDGALVIDVGINVVDGRVLGDVDPAVSYKATLTPVPGGVGAITPYMLFSNLLFLLRKKIEQTSNNSN